MTAAEPRISLTTPAKAEYLVCFRLLLAGLARAGGIDEETLADLKLAVTEACSNSVRHAYGESGDGRVTGRFELGEDYVAIEVEDDGPGFDLHANGVGPSSAGLGLAIIQALTNDFQVAQGPNGRGTLVSFRKAI